MADVVWKDRKRIIFGLPWTFTRYSLTQEKLIVDTGFISRKEDEIRLYRILDITLKRPLGQRIWGLGTISLNTADKTSPEVEIKRIKHAKRVKEMLSDMIERERDEKRIAAREFMGYGDMDDDVDHIN
ncbi:MAG: PH domain-containing protein [Clostridiales bacterium]|nr:PH domain-containing protein [Clostridiales bacterium]